ncbi:endonuclease/exonuclease/phosphatase family protein [Catellatospora sp. KI3]|uniref:endonuclease/exonuclease/phosphatase family protein n=1 Tax=Catellatospora sp. KI3 TaxID=3041620 RepID=UPI0024822FCA|nr:endonuclease/exonuclease/phosphatase family protein [Catellatospora sp. KI3]MDI1460873.1 endonuclease/exonuclease/phosphatase family protein [Catellatospora sp. KI3]
MKPRRIRLSIALAGAVAMLATVVPAAPAQAANAVFRAGTLNIYNGLTHAQFLADLQLITSKADLVGLNEVNARKDFLIDWAQNNGWWFYAPAPSQAENEALLARKSMFDVLDRGSDFVCDTNGPDEVPPARYNNWVKYRHKASGRVVFHLNFHANASIEENGRPVDIPRTQCAEQQFQAIKSLAARKKDEGQVIVSGDLNVDFSADRAVGYANFPWRVFEANQLPNLRSVYNLFGERGTGTHGNRHIDYIYFWKRVEDHQLMWMTDYGLVVNTNSDHRGVVADFAIDIA